MPPFLSNELYHSNLILTQIDSTMGKQALIHAHVTHGGGR